jgi:hypothetical protein
MALVGFLFIVAMVIKLFWWLVAAVGVYYAVRVAQRLQRDYQAAAARTAALNAAIIKRCDQQHAWVQAGDPRGVFGRGFKELHFPS